MTGLANSAPHLAVNGRIWRPSDRPLTVGCGSDNDLVVAGGPEVHQHHAHIACQNGRWFLRPASPTSALWRSGHRVPAVGIDGPMEVTLGIPNGPPLALALVDPSKARGAIATRPAVPTPPMRPPAAPQAGSPPPVDDQAPPPPAARPVPPPRGGEVVRIGRSSENDLVVPDLMVSRRHAELRWNGDHWSLLDLGGPYGTYVDGQQVGMGKIEVGQRLTFGTTSFLLTPTGIEPLSTATAGDGPPILDARHLVVELENGTRILDDVSLAVGAGEVLAIVGPSGSGKSTLLKALTGSRRPEHGAVDVRGIGLYDAYEELCRSIGYVPQDDILHLPLPIRDALLFGAELRFPADTTREDHEERVDEVLAEMELAHRADVPVEKVSGGQRKRTSVALELLTRPELLFLDEPTSGLDPGFERTVMELLRDLASAGRAVVVVTHSLQSLDLCDKVLFLAPGGAIAYLGPPEGALEHFGRPNMIEVFRDLESRTPPPRGDRAHLAPQPESAPLAAGPLPTPRAALPGQPWGRQVAILARRQLAILAADRQNLLFLAGSVLVPSLLILALMGSDTLRLGMDDPVVARQLLGAVVVASVAIGAANAIREIVKELPIYLRERAVGVQRSAYLTSKVMVVGTLTTVQTAVLVIISTLRSGGPGRSNLIPVPHIELILDVALGGLAAVGLGLFLSTVVSSSEKAMALVPVVFVVQWLFSGAALDLQAKPVMREVAQLTSANWAMAASSSSVGEHELSRTCSWADSNLGTGDGTGGYYDANGYWIEDSAGPTPEEQARLDQAPACDSRWESSFGRWFPSILALLVLATAPVFAADRMLARREPLPAQRRLDWPGPWNRGPVRRF